MHSTGIIALQAFSVVRFLIHYAVPVTVFVYCYGRILLAIRRQSKVVTGHSGRGQDVSMATTSRDPNTGQPQQQATAIKLSHTELNVLKTMITVVVCYMICWSVSSIFNLLQLLGVSVVYRP